MSVANDAIKELSSAWEICLPPKRMSVSDAASEYFYINQPGGYIGMWDKKETPYMVEPMDTLSSRDVEAVCFVGPSRGGKCLDINTQILTPEGFKKLSSIKVGDYVFGDDGKPTKVTFVSDVKIDRPCYKVTFSDGEFLIADDEHRWGVERFYWKEPCWRYEVKQTKDIIDDIHFNVKENGKKRFRYRVRNTKPIVFEEKELPIDPYLLGVWLGDGLSRQGTISSHKDDADFYKSEFEKKGHRVDISKEKGNVVRINIDRRNKLISHCQRGHEFAVTGRYSKGVYGGEPLPKITLFNDDFISKLRSLNLFKNKHIPDIYLLSSYEHRLSLIQGLLDTDGYFNNSKGCVEFSTVIDKLKDDFLFLARSLGLKPVARLKNTTWVYNGIKKNSVAWRVNFPLDKSLVLSRLPRKTEKFIPTNLDIGHRQIVSIEQVKSVPVKCISVDNDSHLFLAGYGLIPTHNTMLIEGWITYAVECDPGDMLVVQITQDKAREYSKTRIRRAIESSPVLASKIARNGQDDNTHDKVFKHGMMLKLGWPTVSQLSGSDFRYVALTDYDRMPENIDGEGAAFDLGKKRTQTFLSRGMCYVDSSPGRDFVDPLWTPSTPHEAPPTSGILSIYNSSNRKRWYWPCPSQCDYFQALPGLDLFKLIPDYDDLCDLVRKEDLKKLSISLSKIVCPNCGSLIDQRNKYSMNQKGVWVADGHYLVNGKIEGEALRSNIAGYWLGGVSAAYQKWDSIILGYMQGLREYILTGSEETLKARTNTDQGMPYMPRAVYESAGVFSLRNKVESLERYVVPEWTRVLLASVDVQGGKNARFVVQVHAVGVYMRQAVVDRFDIAFTDDEQTKRRVNPGGNAHDWELLLDKVINASYKTPDGKKLLMYMTAIDSGGEGDTTNMAYQFYRRCAKAGIANKVRLLKGRSTKTDAPVGKSYGLDQNNNKMRDVPIWLIDTSYFKDIVSTMLRKREPEGIYLHLPNWLTVEFFDELQAEVKDEKGKWVKIRVRNEALDLCVYILSLCWMLGFNNEKFNWNNPLPWYQTLDKNINVVSPEYARIEREVKPEKKPVVKNNLYSSEWGSRL